MKFKAILAVCLLGLSSNCFSMGTHGSFFSKVGLYAKMVGNYVKNNPEKVVAGSLPVGLTGFVVGINLDAVLFPAKYSDLDYEVNIGEQVRKELDEIRPFVDRELKKGGFDPEQIKVRFSDSDDNKAFYNNILQLSRFDIHRAGLVTDIFERIDLYDLQGNVTNTWRLEDWTNEDKVRKQDELRFILHHEMGHLKDNYTMRKSVEYSVVPLVTLGAWFALLKRGSHLISSRAVKAAVIAGSVIPIQGVNHLTCLAHMRHLERRADENVPNAPVYLEGGISFFKDALKAEEKAIKAGDLPNVHDTKSFAYYWFASHPTTQSRINRLQERLAQLEDKE